jgi:hypothetical protein
MFARTLALLALSATLTAACTDGSPTTAPTPRPTKASLAIDPAMCDGATMPAIECQALVALYNSTNGPGWTHADGWGVDPNPCNWEWVLCTEGDHGSMLSLFLDLNNLEGTLPPELGNLSEAEMIHIARNNLSGSIPATLSGLSKVEWLKLSHNGLTGSIPASLGQLPAVTSIQLYGNNLTGSIPPELGNASTLYWIFLEGNALTGTIPSSLGNLSQLNELRLNDNQLTGPIPTSLGQLTEMRRLWMEGNTLSGQVPLAFAVLAEDADDGCRFVPGNADLFVPDTPEYRAADEDGDGTICGIGFSTAEEIGEDAIDEIEELVPTVLNEGQANALQSKIDNAMEKASKGQYSAAINQMTAFLTQLNDMVAGGTLTPAQAAPFIQQAQSLIAIWTVML